MSGIGAIEHTYLYPYASQIVGSADSSLLQLATSRSGQSFPYFFEGKVTRPRTAAQLLIALARVVSTRYYMPPNMLARVIAERDPVVTAGGGMLRFEGFSACCSTYARVDFDPDGYSGEIVGRGTTNVDFNPALRASLSKVRDTDRLTVSVGPDELAVKRGFDKIVERKVDLPVRWLKGFVEVQAYQSAMEPRFTVDRLEAIRFLRTLPKTTAPKTTFFVVQAGKGLRLSQTATKDAVPITGLQRLQLITTLVPLADRLKIFAHPSGQASEWQLECGGMTMHLTLTAEVSRGFSGEGQVLSNLFDADVAQLPKLRAALKWQSLIDVADLARQLDLTVEQIRAGLAVLGSRGVVGYDVNNASYFHREMPFDLDAVEEMHPRLKNARELVQSGKVKILRRDGDTIESEVAGTDVNHRVVLKAEQTGGAQCSCPWHSKYQGKRGPCKHVLAAQLMLAGDEGGDEVQT